MARTEEEQKALRRERNKRYYEKHKEKILENQHKNDRKEYYREYNKIRSNSNGESPDNTRKRWTTTDRVKLIKMRILEEKPVKEIAEELQRSEVSIRHELVNDRNNEIISYYKNPQNFD